MDTVTKINRPMKKDELVRHLEEGHGSRPIKAHWTTVAELVLAHRMIHVGIGNSADHTHGTGR